MDIVKLENYFTEIRGSFRSYYCRRNETDSNNRWVYKNIGSQKHPQSSDWYLRRILTKYIQSTTEIYVIIMKMILNCRLTDWRDRRAKCWDSREVMAMRNPAIRNNVNKSDHWRLLGTVIQSSLSRIKRIHSVYKTTKYIDVIQLQAIRSRMYLYIRLCLANNTAESTQSVLKIERRI